MIVVKVCMWPSGDRTRERVLSLAAVDCVGAHPETGERAYRVRLFKDTSFGGPAEAPDDAHIWRSGFVRGHHPGRRGVWDLLGGSLRALLTTRLNGYTGYTPGAPP